MSILIAMALATTCPVVTPKDLPQYLRRTGDTKIVFFASWCADCRDSLAVSHPDGTLFISAFDEKAAAEKVINRFRPSAACFTGDGIAEHYRIKYLPAVITVGPDGQAR